MCKRGMPHPTSCPRCNQQVEDLDHMLLGCVVSREVWTRFFSLWGRVDAIPGTEERFTEWLPVRTAAGPDRRDLWTGVTLICWCLWRHRNGVVFEGLTPSVDRALWMIVDEAELWRSAGLFRGSFRLVERWRVGE